MFVVTPDQVPTDPFARTNWVQAQLKNSGSSFSAIARDLKVSRQSVAMAMYVRSYRIEKALAKALGLKVRDLFPERYSPEGRRLHQVRGTKRSSAADPRNVEDQEAA